MNPYALCDETVPEQDHAALHDIVTKNELVVNALINDGSTVVNNLIAFNDKQIGNFGKQIHRYLGKATDAHDEFLSHLITDASNALQQIIGETQIQTDMLTDIFKGVAGQPQVQPVDMQINTGVVGPIVANVAQQIPQPPVFVPQTMPSPSIERQGIPSPYTSVVGGQSTVSVSVQPSQAGQSPSLSATDEGTNVVFAPTITNATTMLRQSAEVHKERKRKRDEGKKPDDFVGTPVDPLNDPIAWKFSQEDKQWRQKSADFLGPAYDLFLQVGSMKEYDDEVSKLWTYVEGE